jgi:hydrogenase maturation protease
MKMVKIIGIGSPFGQDQVGWQVVDLICERLSIKEKSCLELIKTDRPGMLLLDNLRDTDIAILIDAVADKQRAGLIVTLTKEELIVKNQSFSSHDIGVSEALSLGAVLGELPGELLLLGICIDPECSADIDDSVQKNLAETILRRARKLIRQEISEINLATG